MKEIETLIVENTGEIFVFSALSDFILMMMEFVLVFTQIVIHGIQKENAQVAMVDIKLLEDYVF